MFVCIVSWVGEVEKSYSNIVCADPVPDVFIFINVVDLRIDNRPWRSTVVSAGTTEPSLSILEDWSSRCFSVHGEHRTES